MPKYDRSGPEPPLYAGGESGESAQGEPLLVLAVGLARAAGDVLLRHHGRALDVTAKSSATDPVSHADRASEELLVAGLAEARPDDEIVGEEGARRPGTSGVRWLVDPLDGTVNFLYGYPGWSVSIAAHDAGGGLVGVVHDPVRGETFTASRGGGAFLNGAALSVNDPVPLDRALVATGFSYDPEHRVRQAAVVARLLPRARDIRRAGSAALDLCLLAAGRVDGYYEDATSPWDWAAGALIASEAGARVTSLPGPSGGGVVASGPALHDELMEAVTSG